MGNQTVRAPVQGVTIKHSEISLWNFNDRPSGLYFNLLVFVPYRSPAEIHLSSAMVLFLHVRLGMLQAGGRF